MPVCSDSAVDTHMHLLCREYKLCVNYSLHAQSGGGDVQQLYTCMTESYCVTKYSYMQTLQFYFQATVSADLCFLLSH